MTGHTLDRSVRVMRLAVTVGGQARRNAGMLSDGDDDVVLHIQQKGRRIVSQRDREITVAEGGGLLTSNAEASTITLPGPARFSCIALSRETVRAFAPGFEDSLMRPLSGDAGILRVLTHYLDILDDQAALATPELRRAVATHIQDLCVLAMAATRDAAERALGRGLRAARLRAVKTQIAQNLADIALTAETVAEAQGITSRYVHKLFESEGETFSQYVLGLRLRRVHRLLADPLQAERTIAALAFAAGFADLSTFNRSFRRRYGATPSDVRAISTGADRR
jgi:AraC-like DNA-binding protein